MKYKNKKKRKTQVIYKLIIKKLSRRQLFWLCLVGLMVLGLISVFAPSALLKVF